MDVLLQHVEHDFPTCTTQHLTLVQQANVVASLEQKYGLDSIIFVSILMQCVCVICLTIVEDQINLNGDLNLNLN